MPRIRHCSAPIFEAGDHVQLKSDRRGVDMVVLDHRLSDDAVECWWRDGGWERYAAFDAAALRYVERK